MHQAPPVAHNCRLSCFSCFYVGFGYEEGSDNTAAPVPQMQQYYRVGAIDDRSDKWSAFVDCLTLKAKSSSLVQVCLSFRTPAIPQFTKVLLCLCLSTSSF
uniref:Uncharacterized protein n=1 Tax=Rhizophora mucronata TaxID=61149 RepID=A0A2P2QI93_RHIMU